MRRLQRVHAVTARRSTREWYIEVTALILFYGLQVLELNVSVEDGFGPLTTNYFLPPALGF